MQADTIFVLLQRCLPKHAISSVVGWLCRRTAGALTTTAIRLFVRAYKVDLSDAEFSNPEDYATFNTFFTRALNADARPQPASAKAVSCAADGRISEQGVIADELLIQAKGVNYSLADLFDGDRNLSDRFRDGHFQTLYLAPPHYHRVHMPLGGRATHLRYVPGSLFAVNTRTANRLAGLFCRTERFHVVFATEGFQIAMILVGALNVGSIELCLPARDRFINRPQQSHPGGQTFELDGSEFARGAEFGRFNMGSTVIVLASRGLLQWHGSLNAGDIVRVGQSVGELHS